MTKTEKTLVDIANAVYRENGNYVEVPTLTAASGYMLLSDVVTGLFLEGAMIRAMRGGQRIAVKAFIRIFDGSFKLDLSKITE